MLGMGKRDYRFHVVIALLLVLLDLDLDLVEISEGMISRTL
jgi:hypothetical protein